jgi:hypothetical protein
MATQSRGQGTQPEFPTWTEHENGDDGLSPI